MKEVKLNIEGMHCTGYSTRLEKVLNNVDGVESAKVSLEEKKAEIKYDETQVSEKELIEAILETIGIEMNPIVAAFAMTISSLTVVLNVLRLKKNRKVGN